MPICCMIQKPAIFVWDLVKDKALEQVQAIIPATMIDRLYNRMGLIVKCYQPLRMLFGAYP